MQNLPTVPRIAISLDDEPNENYYNGPLLSLAEALTDVEDLDSDSERSSVTPDAKRKSNLIFAGVGGDGIILTDSEYLEGSDDECDDYRPRAATPLDDVLEFGGTFEDLLQVTSSHKGKNRGAETSKVSTKPGGFLGLPDESREGFTDYEDFDLSDDDWIEEEWEVEDDIDLDDHIPDDGVVDISDRVKRSDQCPSPSVTPEPGQMRQDETSTFNPDVFLKPKQVRAKKSHGNRKSGAAKRKTKSQQFLSPRPEAEKLNDVTDTEVLASDSDDDGSEKRTVRRRRKQKNASGGEGGVTDVEDLDISGDEAYHMKDVDSIPGLPKPTRSVVHISSKSPKAYGDPEEDTDDENMILSDREDAGPIPKRQVKYKSATLKTGGLSVPEAGMDALTDVEDMDGPDDMSEDEVIQRAPSPLSTPLQEMETHYGSVTVSYSTRERERDPDTVESDHGITDHEDFVTDDIDDPLAAHKRKRAVMKSLKKKSRQVSTDEDDFESSDGEFKRGDRGDDEIVPQDVFEIRFMEVEGEARPVIVAPGGKIPIKGKNNKGGAFLEVMATEGGLTDVEEVEQSSPSSDDDADYKPKSTHLKVTSVKRHSLTDVEDFEDDMDEKSSEVTDDEMEHSLPEPVRELTLVHYQTDGRPVVVTIPLADDHRVGLMVQEDQTAHALTDVEDFDVDEPDTCLVEEMERPPTPEIEMDFGIIDASEGMKVERKLRVQSVSHPPLTDTEDIYFEGEHNRRKKIKPKGKLLVPKTVQRSGGTDVEELDMSDGCDEVLEAEGIIIVRRPIISLTPAGGNVDAKTDVEDMSGDSGDENDTPSRRPVSVTPDCIKNMDYSTVTFHEGSAPFPNDVRRNALDPSRIVPTIRMTSPTPDINPQEQTDSEDMQTSADEAETTVPPEDGIDIEEGTSTYVHVKHTRKRDYEAAEEAINMKCGDMRDTHTDVEDIVSEDERKVEDQISVEDTVDKVCVCVGRNADDPAVCVCVGKVRGDLSMVWRDGNVSTSATDQRSRNVTQEWGDISQAKDGVPTGDTSGEWGPPETQSVTSTTTTTTSTTRGPEGVLEEGGAAGGQGSVTVTTTETRSGAEVSEEMKELLAKMSAEHRQ